MSALFIGLKYVSFIYWSKKCQSKRCQSKICRGTSGCYGTTTFFRLTSFRVRVGIIKTTRRQALRHKVNKSLGQEPSDQSYKASSLVNYDPRVASICNLLVITS